MQFRSAVNVGHIWLADVQEVGPETTNAVFWNVCQTLWGCCSEEVSDVDFIDWQKELWNSNGSVFDNKFNFFVSGADEGLNRYDKEERNEKSGEIQDVILDCGRLVGMRNALIAKKNFYMSRYSIRQSILFLTCKRILFCRVVRSVWKWELVGQWCQWSRGWKNAAKISSKLNSWLSSWAVFGTLPLIRIQRFWRPRMSNWKWKYPFAINLFTQWMISRWLWLISEACKLQ